jgi:uncharacterized membrane protein (DUF485 family)
MKIQHLTERILQSFHNLLNNKKRFCEFLENVFLCGFITIISLIIVNMYLGTSFLPIYITIIWASAGLVLMTISAILFIWFLS